MNIRNAVIALLGAATLPALANSGVTSAATEAGYTTHAMAATKTRAQVMSELLAWKRNPVTADGWRQVDDERGWVYEGRKSEQTRAAVIEEMLQAKRNPVSADGWLNVGGEAGAIFVGAQPEDLDRHASRRAAASRR
ncbi:MAG: hypothetical protein KIT17_01350 [Rubrivivax sp.]|nr:hypothetical protein [Rubrivivax sp.]